MTMQTPNPQRVEKKSVVLPLIGALVFLAPGLVTWTFAKGEATRMGSDWVYISTPLLLLGSLCVVLFFHRLLGKAGLIVGAVVALGGLIYIYTSLNAAITERVRYRAMVQALQDTERFCTGRGTPDSRARDYDPKKPGRYATYVVDVRRGGGPQSSYKPEYEGFRPKPFSIEEAALIACVIEVEKTVQTCAYDGGATMERLQVDYNVKVYAIKTGEVVFQTELKGTPPRACEVTEKFYGKEGKTGSISGTPPTLGSVADALRPHVYVK